MKNRPKEILELPTALSAKQAVKRIGLMAHNLDMRVPDFLRKVRVHKSTYSRWKNGIVKPDLETIYRISVIYNVMVNNLNRRGN